MAIHNLVPQDYRKYTIVTRKDGQYYLAKKCGSTWNVGLLENCVIVPYDKVPATPWILIEYGECLHYEKYTRVLADVDYKAVQSFLKG